MAITLISSTARPADNQTFGGNANNNLLINPIGAATGDLVFVIGQYRGATLIEVDETGGQVWNSLTAFIDAANLCQVRIFWCRWSDEAYNGNNPNFFANGISGNPFTCTGHIFRPTTSTKLWAIDTAHTSTQFSAPSSPLTVTRSGVTTTNPSTVTIATWHTADLNTWDTLSGTGWVSMGDAQNRNTTGGGQSSTRAYKIMTSAGATGDVSKNQATNGGDAGVTSIISFYEYDPGYTMTVSPGSFAITGNEAGLLVGRSLQAEAGPFTLTGNDAGLKANRQLSAAAGSFSLTGQDVDLKVSRVVQAQPGSFTLSGNQSSLLANRRLTAGVGSFILTGQNVNLITSTYRMIAEPGQFVFTGNPVTLRYETVADQIINGIAPPHQKHFH